MCSAVLADLLAKHSSLLRNCSSCADCFCLDGYTGSPFLVVCGPLINIISLTNPPLLVTSAVVETGGLIAHTAER